MSTPPSWDRCRAELNALRAADGSADLPTLVERASRLRADLAVLSVNLPPQPDAESVRILAARARMLRESLGVGSLKEGGPELAPFRDRLLTDATIAEIREVLQQRTADIRDVNEAVVALRQEAEAARRLAGLMENYVTLLRTLFACVCSAEDGQ
jgi:hypothetical protein